MLKTSTGKKRSRDNQGDQDEMEKLCDRRGLGKIHLGALEFRVWTAAIRAFERNLLLER